MSMPNFGPIGLQIWPPGGISQKHKSSISEVTMTARVTKLYLYVYLVKLHFLYYRFLIWLTFQGHWGQSSKFHSWATNLLAIWPRELFLGVIDDVPRHPQYLCQISPWLDSRWQSFVCLLTLEELRRWDCHGPSSLKYPQQLPQNVLKIWKKH